MGTIKNRNGKDLVETEEIKKWQEYTEELYKTVIKKKLTWITGMTLSLSQSQTFWSVKSSGP